jgi:hypothetical protein
LDAEVALNLENYGWNRLSKINKLSGLRSGKDTKKRIQVDPLLESAGLV